MFFETIQLLDQTEQILDVLKYREIDEERLIVRETRSGNDKDVRSKTSVPEEIDKTPKNSVHDTQKCIAEVVEKYEAEIVKYALEEIMKSKKETLKYIVAELQTHKAKAYNAE